MRTWFQRFRQPLLACVDARQASTPGTACLEEAAGTEGGEVTGARARANSAGDHVSGWRPAVQVPPGHYGAGYDDWDKWVTYFWEIRNVLDRGLDEVLEIGIGSKVVTSYQSAY